MSELTESAAALRMLTGKLSRRLRASAPPGDLTWSPVEGVRTQSMGATVASLLAVDMVQGEADPHDGRKTSYSPTPAARVLIAANRAMRDDWLVRAIDTQLSASEQQLLLSAIPLLQRLADNAS